MGMGIQMITLGDGIGITTREWEEIGIKSPLLQTSSAYHVISYKLPGIRRQKATTRLITGDMLSTNCCHHRAGSASELSRRDL